MREPIAKISRFFIHTDRGNIIFIVGVALILLMLWSSFLGRIVGITEDTATYFLAGEMFMRGYIDYLRTPIYPLICQAFLHCFGDSVFEALAILNFLVFFVSIIILYRTIALFAQRRIAKVITTVLYAWSIPMYEVCMLIMTESINLCGIILLTYFLSLIYLGKGNARIIWLVSAILLFLVLLRPFNIVFIPISLLVIFAAYRRRQFTHLRTTGISFSSTLTVVLSYCIWFKITYGIFALSYVSSINQYFICHSFDNSKNCGTLIETAACIGNKNYPVWVWANRDSGIENMKFIICDEYQKFAYSQIDFFSRTCYHLFPHADSIMDKTYPGTVQCLYLGTIYIILAMLFVLQLYLWFTNRRYCVDVIAGHLIICAVVIITTIFGSAHFDAPRLLMPMFPSLCLLAGLVFEQLSIRMRISIPSQSNFK